MVVVVTWKPQPIHRMAAGSPEPGELLTGDVCCISAAAVAQRVGATARQVDHWTRRGYLQPENLHPGIGQPLRYPHSEVAVAALMVRLVQGGVQPGKAHPLARALLAAPTAMLGPGLVLVDIHNGRRWAQ